jgi:hypothetical protein
MSKSITQTKVAAIKREAKAVAKSTGTVYSQALELVARQQGFASWFDVTVASKNPGPSSTGALLELPVDPKLRRGFDNTAHEDRSAAELKKWWLKPFAVTREDGTYDVRCLSSGAWDRSIWYGCAPTLDAARELATAKLAEWRAFMDTPVMTILGEDSFAMTVEPLLPTGQRAVLAYFETQAEAIAWRAAWDALLLAKPEEAKRKLAEARERASNEAL